jgi:MFS family permease
MLRTSYRSAVTIGGILLIIGSVLLTLMEPVNGMVWACAGATFVGVGLGFLNTPFVVAVQDVAAWNLRGAATASNAFNRMLGASLGTAVFSAVMNASLVRSLPTEDDPIQDLVDPAKRATLDAATLIHVSDAVATAMEYAFAVGVVIAVVALIIGRGLPPGMKPGNVRRGTAED